MRGIHKRKFKPSPTKASCAFFWKVLLKKHWDPPPWRQSRATFSLSVDQLVDVCKLSLNQRKIIHGVFRCEFSRRDLQTTISVDGKVTTIVSSSEATQLNTNGLVYLGKPWLSEVVWLALKRKLSGGRRRHGLQHKFKGTFVGCVRRLTIRGTSIDLHSDVVSARSPPECRLSRS